MKVFVAVVAYYFESDEVLGVFSTYEKAMAVGEERRVVTYSTPSGGVQSYTKGDKLIIEEWEVE